MSWYRTSRYGGAEGERSMWYHGTRGRNLQSILSQGLIPDPKEREWSEDKDVGFGSMPRTSIGGIYVTQNLMTAISSANRSRDRQGGEPAVVVIMELQPRTMIVDEDDISVAQHALPWNYVTEYWLAETFMLREVGGPSYASHINKMKDEYVERVLSHAKYKLGDLHPAMEASATKLLRDMWDAVLDRQAAYVYQPDGSFDWRKAFWSAVPEATRKRIDREMEDLGWSRDGAQDRNDAIYREVMARHVPKHPNADEANSRFMGYMDRLTRLFKAMSRPSKTGEQRSHSETGRVVEPIGFSGSNRIVGIAEIVRSSKELYLEDVRVVWGSLPDKFVSDWKRSVGDLRIRDNAAKASEPVKA